MQLCLLLSLLSVEEEEATTITTQATSTTITTTILHQVLQQQAVLSWVEDPIMFAVLFDWLCLKISLKSWLIYWKRCLCLQESLEIQTLQQLQLLFFKEDCWVMQPVIQVWRPQVLVMLIWLQVSQCLQLQLQHLLHHLNKTLFQDQQLLLRQQQQQDSHHLLLSRVWLRVKVIRTSLKPARQQLFWETWMTKMICLNQEMKMKMMKMKKTMTSKTSWIKRMPNALTWDNIIITITILEVLRVLLQEQEREVGMTSLFSRDSLRHWSLPSILVLEERMSIKLLTWKSLLQDHLHLLLLLILLHLHHRLLLILRPSQRSF